MEHKIKDSLYLKINSSNFKLILDKNNSNITLERLKIYNDKCLFLTGIPYTIKPDNLKKFKYLGQYGHIVSIKKCFSLIEDRKFYSIFAIFKDELNLNLAIKCLNNFKLNDTKIMKCSYATNKICNDYVMKGDCKRSKCFYYHGKITKENSILKILNYNNKSILNFFKNINEKFINRKINNIKDLNSYNKKKTIFPNLNNYITSLKSKNKLQTSSTLKEF